LPSNMREGGRWRPALRWPCICRKRDRSAYDLPQADDRERYAQTQTGQTLPRYDPLISEKIKIAYLAQQLAADAVRCGEEEGQLGRSSCFEAWELSPPTEDK
jgi:hypothetical protein